MGQVRKSAHVTKDFSLHFVAVGMKRKHVTKDFSLHFVALEMTASLNEKGGIRRLRRRIPPLNLTFSCHPMFAIP